MVILFLIILGKYQSYTKYQKLKILMNNVFEGNNTFFPLSQTNEIIEIQNKR